MEESRVHIYPIQPKYWTIYIFSICVELIIFSTFLDELQWIQPRTGGLFPCKKYGHLLATNFDDNPQIMVFGGMEPKYLSKPDIFILSETGIII